MPRPALLPRRLPLLGLLAALLAAPAPTRAQTSPDKAAATALFKEGKALMDARRHAEACPKLAESFRLEPAGGTLLNLAVCHEAEGKLATAWSEFTAALTMARRDGREERVRLAQQRLAAIEPRMPRLTVQVPAAARVDGLEVKRDGVQVGAAAFGSAIPLDPGEHVLEASAPGRHPWSSRFSLSAEENRSVEVPVLEALPSEPAPPESAAPPASSAPPPPPESHAAAYTLLAVGAVGLGVGAVFGLKAISERRRSDDQCPGERCTPQGYDLNETAKRSADVSTVAFGVALLSSGIGAYLWLRDPSPAPSPGVAGRFQLSPALGPGHAGLDLRARW